ncbi:hypothetical protein ASG92_22890 [Arthrobacter sp. Soil736]|nr:hypothetical protein ASG92_22890 [Arthrobacter sp. Soil736]
MSGQGEHVAPGTGVSESLCVHYEYVTRLGHQDGLMKHKVVAWRRVDRQRGSHDFHVRVDRADL